MVVPSHTMVMEKDLALSAEKLGFPTDSTLLKAHTWYFFFSFFLKFQTVAVLQLGPTSFYFPIICSHVSVYTKCLKNQLILSQPKKA